VSHILSAEGRVVVDVLTALEQMQDAIGIEIQGGHLLPEPLRQLLVGLIELGMGELMHQQSEQMALLQCLERFLRCSDHGWSLQRRGQNC